MAELDFVENAAIWTFAGLLAFSTTPLAAIAFLTIAPKFVIALRTGDLGGIVTLYVDGIAAAVVDTHADTVGVIETILVGDPDNDTHQIYVQKDDDPDTIIEVIRKELSPDEVTPANIRYNDATDAVQQSSDGGTTWNDAPGLDPRSADSFRVPDNSTGAPQCNACANMVAYLQSLVALDISNAEMVGIVAGFVTVLLPEIPVIGWIIDAVILAAETIIALGATAISSAFTSDVYDALLCTFVAHTDAEGQMSDAQNVAFINEVFAAYSSTVYDVVLAHNLTLGAVGWSNAGALGEITDADCSACSSWCITVDLTSFDGGFTIDQLSAQNAGVWTDGVGWQQTSVIVDVGIGIYYQILGLGLNLGSETALTHITEEFTFTAGVIAGSDATAYITNQDFSYTYYSLPMPDVPTSPISVDTGGIGASGLHIAFIPGQQNGSDPGGTVALTRMTLEGTGDKPTLPNWVDC